MSIAYQMFITLGDVVGLVLLALIILGAGVYLAFLCLRDWIRNLCGLPPVEPKAPRWPPLKGGL